MATRRRRDGGSSRPPAGESEEGAGAFRDEALEIRRRYASNRPRILRLLGQARQHIATETRGLSEQVQALGQHLAQVGTKVDRLQMARGRDREAVAQELEEEWSALDACARRVRDTLERTRDA